MPHEWVNPGGQGTGVLLGLAFFFAICFYSLSDGTVGFRSLNPKP